LPLVFQDNEHNMQDKATPWAIFTTLILFICYGIWAWFEWQGDPTRFPFEPLIAALATLLALIGFLVYQQKEVNNQRSSTIERKPLRLSDQDKTAVRTALKEGEIGAAFDVLDRIPGGSDLAIEQGGHWRNAKRMYDTGLLDYGEFEKTQRKVVHALLAALNDNASAERLPNPNLSFRPQYAFFRFLFRRIPALDRRKGYLKPLISPIFSKKELLNALNNYDPHNVPKLPESDELAKELQSKPFQAFKKLLAHDVLSYFLKGILVAEKPYFVMVLADSGIGKTTFLQKIFFEHARRYPAESLAFVYAGTHTLADLRSIADPGNTVLFLDALDEDDGARQNLELQMDTLSKWLLEFKKVIITCRTQLFLDNKGVRLSGKLHFLTLRLQTPYDTSPKAEAYLRKYLAPERYAIAVQLYRSNRGFFENPLLLSWFDVLTEGIDASTKRFEGLFEVYERIVEDTARREADVAEGGQHIVGNYPERLRHFSKGIALELYNLARRGIEEADVTPFIAARADVALLKRIDAQSRSFLTRDGDSDQFRFRHAAFKDYFLALALWEQDLREEDFPFAQYPEVARFYRGMCWKYGAQRRSKEMFELELSDNVALKNLNSAVYPLLVLMPNRALRARILRHEKELLNWKETVMWGELAAFLIARLQSGERSHYILEMYETVCNTLKSGAMLPTAPDLYEKQFYAEHLYQTLMERFGKAQTSEHSLSIRATNTEYFAAIPPGFYEPDFGRVLQQLFANNHLLEKQFCASRSVQFKGLNIQDLDFLGTREKQLKNLECLDLADNQISDSTHFKALLRLPKLMELYLDGNLLPSDLLLPEVTTGNNCLRALRNTLLNPPDMIRVPGGAFQMGQPDPKMYNYTNNNGVHFDSSDEQPVHWVLLDDFFMAPYAVTLGEFRQFIEDSGYCTEAEEEGQGSYLYDPDEDRWILQSGICWQHDVQGALQTNERHPVLHISWYDAVSYCNWLSERTGKIPAYRINTETPDPDNLNEADHKKWRVERLPEADGYRLPTEAEWEYAATYMLHPSGKGRADINARFGNSKDEADPAELNFDASARYKAEYSKAGIFRACTLPVGSLEPPNALGIYELSGNIYEWCQDWYADDYYHNSSEANPQGPNQGSYRVIRGGSWNNDSRSCRAAYRNFIAAVYRNDNFGFRLVSSALQSVGRPTPVHPVSKRGRTE
jgi:formylglycine-generating enzyme required for sulfatase activity